MQMAVLQGFLYFAIVFAIGFALGVLRVLFVVPQLGETLAVLVEAPVMLGTSFVTCFLLLRRHPLRVNGRVTMAATALIALAVVETGMSLTLFGRSWAEFFAQYETLGGLIGLSTQVGFGILPLLLPGKLRREDRVVRASA